MGIFMPHTPSYLTKRNGIYYFQLTIPKQAQSHLRLFRRSLHTRCRKTALAKARKWWVLINENNYHMPDVESLDAIERGAQEVDAVLAIGKAVYQRLQDHEQKNQYHNGQSDPLAVQDFFDSLTPAQWNALQRYNSYLNSKPEEDSDHKLNSNSSFGVQIGLSATSIGGGTTLRASWQGLFSGWAFTWLTRSVNPPVERIPRSPNPASVPVAPSHAAPSCDQNGWIRPPSFCLGGS